MSLITVACLYHFEICTADVMVGRRDLAFHCCLQYIVGYICAYFTFYLFKIQPKIEDSRVISHHHISWGKFILTQVNIEG